MSEWAEYEEVFADMGRLLTVRPVRVSFGRRSIGVELWRREYERGAKTAFEVHIYLGQRRKIVCAPVAADPALRTEARGEHG
ncbi:hypothetical protein D1114_07290 [Cereibacter sphaeroides]|uniref:Uncharacterized protein n=2 Tax=Cereibacter sphaeroides TaxID=1063 RepID=A0AAX1UNL6_CERSP|nr:hypothetical protein D1114_07290 [Cereibacter sphaeroides]